MNGALQLEKNMNVVNLVNTKIAEKYDTTLTLVKNRERIRHEESDPKFWICYIMRRYFGFGLVEIAQYLKYSHHSVILKNVKYINDQLDNDEPNQYKEDMKAIHGLIVDAVKEDKAPLVDFDMNSLNVVNEVCVFYNVNPNEIINKDRRKSIVYIRSWAMYFLNKKLNRTYNEIGKLFQCHHTTVIYNTALVNLSLNNEWPNRYKEDYEAISKHMRYSPSLTNKRKEETIFENFTSTEFPEEIGSPIEIAMRVMTKYKSLVS